MDDDNKTTRVLQPALPVQNSDPLDASNKLEQTATVNIALQTESLFISTAIKFRRSHVSKSCQAVSKIILANTARQFMCKKKIKREISSPQHRRID